MKQTAPTNFLLFITILLMDFLTGMEFDLFVPSFPELQHHFQLAPFWVEALLSANFVGYCLSLFFLGDLSDRYGRKPCILLGLVIFIIGSIMCLWPITYAFLLIGRFLQGLGIAAPGILSFVIIADMYSLKQQQFFMGVLNGVMNVAVAAAPVIGSYITLYFHWQGNFSALLAFGLVTLMMTLFFIPLDQPKHKETHELSGLRGYLEIWQSKPLLLLMTCLLFIFVPYWIFVGMSPLLYIKEMGVSLTHFGYYQGILALVFALGSVIYGLIIKNVDLDQKKMLYLSLQIFVFSIITFGLITLQNSTNPLLITLALLPFIIAQVIPTVILYPICLNYIPHAKGRISAVIHGARLILTAIGLQLAGYFYQGTIQSVGIITLSYIAIGVITLYFVIHNREIMTFTTD